MSAEPNPKPAPGARRHRGLPIGEEIPRPDVLAGLSEEFEGDPEILRSIVSVFLDSTPTLWGEIQRTFACRDEEAFKRGVHTLKGSLSHFRSAPAYQTSVELDHQAKERSWAAAGNILPRLDRKLTDLTHELRQALQRLG